MRPPAFSSLLVEKKRITSPFTRPWPSNLAESPKKTSRSPSTTSRMVAEPPYTCTSPCTGWSMMAFRPKTYSPARDGRAFAVSAGAASIAVTTSAAAMAMMATSLRIDASRGPADQQDQESVDGEEKDTNSDVPGRRCMRRGITGHPDQVPDHLKGAG